MVALSGWELHVPQGLTFWHYPATILMTPPPLPAKASTNTGFRWFGYPHTNGRGRHQEGRDTCPDFRAYIVTRSTTEHHIPLSAAQVPPGCPSFCQTAPLSRCSACKSWPWSPTPTADKKSRVRVGKESVPPLRARATCKHKQQKETGSASPASSWLSNRQKN